MGIQHTLQSSTNQFLSGPSIFSYSGEAPDLSTVKPSLVLDLFTKLTMENKIHLMMNMNTLAESVFLCGDVKNKN